MSTKQTITKLSEILSGEQKHSFMVLPILKFDNAYYFDIEIKYKEQLRKQQQELTMKKGTKVSWQVQQPEPCGRGWGMTIQDEDDTGHILVSVASLKGEVNPGYHIVICCTVTWLTVEN